MANAWLASGATRYSIIDADGLILKSWAAACDRSSKAPDLCAPIVHRKKMLGQLQVNGLCNAESDQRLVADAQLIAKFSLLDDDLAELTEEVVARQDELVAMLELTQSTRNQLDVAQLTHSVLQRIPHLFSCEIAFIVADKECDMMLPSLQYPEALAVERPLLYWLAIVQTSGEQLIVNRNSAETPLPENTANLLVAPLTIRGEIHTAIGLINKKNGDFNYPDRKLLSAIAQQVAAQFENALLHAESIQQAKRKHEYDLAHKVQMRLLPTVAPRAPQLEIVASSRPARAVGGDFYDYLPVDDGLLRFTVGDVSGKGMPAAMLMGMAHSTLRSAARFLVNPSPASILERANTALYDDFTEVAMFATVFVGQYDPATRAMIFANAGHSPVIYCPRDGDAVLLEADGTALGILTESLSEDHMLTFNEGDLLIVASDGLPEAHNAAGEMFGYKRLLGLIEQHRNDSAENIRVVLDQTIRQFSGDTEQDDDETIMILKGIE